jgi:hypothetical protein
MKRRFRDVKEQFMWCSGYARDKKEEMSRFGPNTELCDVFYLLDDRPLCGTC